MGHLLARAEVTDLTIEDPPLEEVMRELFARGEGGEEREEREEKVAAEEPA